nr:DUF177 domain-containing protein [uncultured Schaedlerella sp.]
MLMNLSGVLSEQHRPIDEMVLPELDSVQLKSGAYPVIHKDPVHVTVTHRKDRELQIQADGKVTLRIPCDRCLEEVEYEFPLHFTRYVDLGCSDAELREGFDESDFINGYHLDVDKMLFQEILMCWPEKVLCREDCRGICNVCGQNLNQGSCDCEDTGLDPRMSVVRELFKNFKEV